MVAFVTKKFHLDEMKIVCDKNFFVKSHPGGLAAENCGKRAIFGNFSSFYIKNHPEGKIIINEIHKKNNACIHKNLRYPAHNEIE